MASCRVRKFGESYDDARWCLLRFWSLNAHSGYTYPDGRTGGHTAPFEAPSKELFLVPDVVHSVQFNRLEQRQPSDESGNPSELLLWHRLRLELLRRLATVLFVPCLGRFFVDLRRKGLRSAGFQKSTVRATHANMHFYANTKTNHKTHNLFPRPGTASR